MIHMCVYWYLLHINDSMCSDGYCNVCGLISEVAEGCEIRSATPVCDHDESTTGIQDAAETPRKVAKCVACTKSGEYILG